MRAARRLLMRRAHSDALLVRVVACRACACVYHACTVARILRILDLACMHAFSIQAHTLISHSLVRQTDNDNLYKSYNHTLNELVYTKLAKDT